MSNDWDNFARGGPPTEPPTQATLPPPHLDPEPRKVVVSTAPPKGFHGFMLPRDVMDNAHWKGDESDLKFGLREPDAEGTWRFMETMAGADSVLPFIARAGDHSGGHEINTWWMTRTQKVKACIMQAFVALVVPTTLDVEAVRSSKRRAGDQTNYRLPDSVMDSIHWRGTEASLVFGLRDATTAEIRLLSATEGSMEDCVPFVCMPDAKAWWDTLSPKAQGLVNRMFVDTLVPTEDEGKAIRASRTWVEG